MQPKATLLIGLALALAAGTALFFVLDRPGAAPRSSAGASAARPGQAADGPRADLAAAQSIAETEAGAARVAASTAKSVLPGKEAIRAALGEEGGQELYGRILGGFGAPVAGAEVELEGLGDTADGLLQVLGGSTDKHAVTGPDGTFRTPRPARWEEVNVKVKARGYLPYEQPQDLLEADGDQNLGVFELSPGVVLGGRVVDAAGEPIAGAEVRRVEESQDFNFGMRFNRDGVIETDADGRFLMPNEEPGPYVLLVEHPTYPQGRFTGDTPPAGGEDTSLVLALAHAASVAGKLEGFPGDREHVRVSAMLRDAGAGTESVMADMMEDAGFGPEALESAVAADGAFRIEGLEAGRSYSIRAYTRGGFFGRDACSDERVVLAGAGDARLTWKPGGALAFRVVDGATRNPLDGVEVRYRWERQGGSGFPDGTRTRKFAEGQVLLDELRPKGGQTSLSLIVSAPGYLELRRDDVAVSGEERVDLGTLELQPAATLRVAVVDAEGKPVSGAKVRLVPLNAEGEDGENGNQNLFFTLKARSSSGKSDSAGICELAAVTTPTARLDVTHPRFCDFTAPEVPMPAQGVGEQFARLIEGGRVVVLVVDALGQPVADVQVDHQYPEGSQVDNAEHSTNKRGEVRLKNQAPGEHKFRTEEQGAEIGVGDEREEAWQDVLVVDGKEARVTLEVAARATLEGVITQAGAPLDRATVSLLKPEEGESEEIVIEFQAQLGRYSPGGFDSTDRTDRKGSYKLEDVPAGKYRLGVSHPDRALPHVVQVDVHNGVNHLDLDLPVTAIEGRVTDSEGRPLAGARVRVTPAPKEGTGDEVESGRDAMAEYFGGNEGGEKTDADGRYRVVGVPADKAVVVRASEAEHVAGKSKEVTLASGELRERVDLQLDPGGVLRVRVLTETGPFTFLQATYAGGGDVPPRMAAVRRGEAVFRGLKPGPWKVTRAGDDDDGGEQEDEKFAAANVTASSETLVDFAP